MNQNVSKPVGIWIRVSTEDQARGDSPEHHEKRARHYAEAKGWKVREVYHLEAVSGKSVIGHPEAKKMLEHIASGHITGLIFSKLARLARNTRELLDFADIFREHDADLISLQESIDTSTPAGRLFYTMIAAMAQWEREEIADRVRASVPIRAKMGRKIAGATCLGYQYKSGQFSIDPTEAPVRKLIYELFLEHRRKKAVARMLNEKGLRTRKGAKFTDTTVDRLLRDSTAMGIYRANYSRSSGKKRLLKPKEDWVYIKVPPIVPEELWKECNAILDDQQRKKKPPAKRAVHLFAGFAYCDCGTKMYVPSNSPKYTCPKCRNKIGVTDLEEVFHHQLQSFFMSPTEVAGYLAKGDQVIKEKEELLRALEDEKGRVVKDRDGVLRAYLDELMDGPSFGAAHRPLEERVRQIDDQIPEIQGEIDFLKIQLMSSDKVLVDAQDLYSRWSQLARDEKRKIIESITENISVGKEDIAINLCYLPSSSENVAERQRTLSIALPFCHLRLNAKKPYNPKYCTEPQTLGDHLKNRRLALRLDQQHVAKLLRIWAATYSLWELNRTAPKNWNMRKVVQFLGFCPIDSDDTPGRRLAWARHCLGLSQKRLARMAGMNPVVVWRLETEAWEGREGYLSKVRGFMEAEAGRQAVTGLSHEL